MSGVSSKQYNDLPYTREVVDKAEVLALIRDVLGLNQGELSKLVVDGKVTPVVVLNDSVSYSRWNYLGKLLDMDFLLSIDNYGNCFVHDLNIIDWKFVDKNLEDLTGGVGAPDYVDYYGHSWSMKNEYILVDSAFPVYSVYRYGVFKYSFDLSDEFAAVTHVHEGNCVSPNGKYIGLIAGDNVGNHYLMLYEGVV